MIVMFFRRVPTTVLMVSVSGLLALSGCSSATVAGAMPGDDRKLQLVASFYPLQWTAQQVAGDRGTVASLTKPGAEPHDLELTPREVAAAADADLVIYVKGFQPAVDGAVSQEAGDHGFDVSPAADLNLRYTLIEEGQEHADEKGATDPHFWLDPIRLAAVADAIAARLSKLDPTRADAYRANAATLTRTLRALDQDFTTGLGHCANPDLVTSHNAFGYLAQRYGLTQVGITGLTPEDEPKPGDLATIAAFVEKNRVRTIYYETLVSPAIAKTVAAETGAKTAVLDPIEGLTKDSQGSNYLQVMRANLANIEHGQPCE
jgi:zinc transport system substrate-binding protein